MFSQGELDSPLAPEKYEELKQKFRYRWTGKNSDVMPFHHMFVCGVMRSGKS